MWDETLARERGWLLTLQDPLWPPLLGLSHLPKVRRNTGFLELLSSAKEWERLEGLGDPWQGLSDLDEASVPTVFYYTALASNIPWMFTVPSLIKIFSCLCTIWLLAPILLEIPGSSIFLSFYLTLGMQDEKVRSFIAVQMQLGIINSTFYYCGHTIIHTRPSSDVSQLLEPHA